MNIVRASLDDLTNALEKASHVETGGDYKPCSIAYLRKALFPKTMKDREVGCFGAFEVLQDEAVAVIACAQSGPVRVLYREVRKIWGRYDALLRTDGHVTTEAESFNKGQLVMAMGMLGQALQGIAYPDRLNAYADAIRRLGYESVLIESTRRSVSSVSRIAEGCRLEKKEMQSIIDVFERAGLVTTSGFEHAPLCGPRGLGSAVAALLAPTS